MAQFTTVLRPELGNNVGNAKRLYGRWQTNGTGAPVKVSGTGASMTLARTGVGVYTCTLDGYPGGILVGHHVSWRRAAIADSTVSVTTWTTAGVLTITHVAYTAPTVAVEWPATATDVELSIELIIGSAPG